MGVLLKRWGNLQWGITLLLGGVILTGVVFHVGRFGRADQPQSPSGRSIALGQARPDTLYAVTVWMKDPSQLQADGAVLATVKDGKGEVESKWLHSSDLDFYLTLRPRVAGPDFGEPVRSFGWTHPGNRRELT